MVNQDNESKQSPSEKPKIKPSLKINPNAKGNNKDDSKAKEDTNASIMQRIKDLENEQKDREKEKTTDEAKLKIANEINILTHKADLIYSGKDSYEGKSEEDRIQDLYDLYNEITESNYNELSMFVKYNLEYEEHQKLHNIIIQNVNKEETVIQKLKIIIRDLQEKTPLIQEEVQNFVDEQKSWRVEKEEEFQKSIENIRSQMQPSAASTEGEGDQAEETPESAMQAKYKELCEYVGTMKKEVDQFKEAREKLIIEREEKIKELEDTKNVKLVESKRNIEEKIQALQKESSKLKKELPSSRKDFAKHKGESKKLVAIIEANNKKRKELKDHITKLNKELQDVKGEQKQLNEGIAALQSTLKDKLPDVEKVDNELLEVADKCKKLQDQINDKKA